MHRVIGAFKMSFSPARSLGVASGIIAALISLIPSVRAATDINPASFAGDYYNADGEILGYGKTLSDQERTGCPGSIRITYDANKKYLEATGVFHSDGTRR